MREAFNTAYWLAQPPEIEALHRMPRQSSEDAEARFVEAVRLAMEGHGIDKQIHAEGLEPWATMWLRQRYGYTWVPSVLQVPNFDLAPGIAGMPGRPYDPAHPMPGSIEVSLDPADYPEWAPVTTPEPPMVPAVAGPILTPTIRAAVAGDTSPAGTAWTDPQGRKWVKVAVQVPFGWHVWWERE